MSLNELLDIKQLFIFDRDGVINESATQSRYILSRSELVLRPIIVSSIVNLQKIGKEIAVATNQQGVGLGYLSLDDLAGIEDHINQEILQSGGKAITFFTCIHQERDKCSCRKPNPLLLENAMRHFACPPESSIFIGDQETDLEAAKNASIDFLYESEFGILIKNCF